MPPLHYDTPTNNEQWQAYYDFRWQQLRAPLGLAAGTERDALEAQAYHRICLTEDHNIVAVGRIHFETSRQQQLARIRYMAVASEYQKQGIGRALVAQLLEHAQGLSVAECYLHAREQACGFYQALGFELKGRVPSALDQPHFLMRLGLR